MQATVTRVQQKDLNFATAKRMLVRVMKLLHVAPAKLGQFHEPKEKNGKWVWMLVSHSQDPSRKVPIYFSVDTETLVAQLSVTRKTKKELSKWELKLPSELDDINGEDVLDKLGFKSVL